LTKVFLLARALFFFEDFRRETADSTSEDQIGIITRISGLYEVAPGTLDYDSPSEFLKQEFGHQDFQANYSTLFTNVQITVE